MLTIWGRPTAFNAQKVVWAAEEVGIPYERIDAGTKWGVVDTPEYRRLNPNGLVPVIQNGDYVLWESNTIVRYLSGKYGRNDLYPADFLTRIEAGALDGLAGNSRAAGTQGGISVRRPQYRHARAGAGIVRADERSVRDTRCGTRDQAVCRWHSLHDG